MMSFSSSIIVMAITMMMVALVTIVSLSSLNDYGVEALDNGLGATPAMGWNTW
jgi:hypothetical protein